jgi:hypothetical protein
MKKHFYLLIAGILTFCTVHAQIKKGQVQLGGSLSFYTGSAKFGNYSNNSTNVTISPAFGMAVQDNLVLGISLLYGHNPMKYGDPQYESGFDQYGGGIFVRRYKPIGKSFSVFMQWDLLGEYDHTNTGYKDSVVYSNVKIYNFNTGLYPGIAYNISRRVQVETSLPYLIYVNYQRNKAEGENYNNVLVKTNTLNIGCGLSRTLQNLVIGIKCLL